MVSTLLSATVRMAANKPSQRDNYMQAPVTSFRIIACMYLPLLGALGCNGMTQRIGLKKSLKTYWLNLVVIGATPALFVIFSRIPIVGFKTLGFVVFFGSTLYASWPFLKKGAPFSYCLVSGVIWMTGAIPAILIARILNKVIG